MRQPVYEGFPAVYRWAMTDTLPPLAPWEERAIAFFGSWMLFGLYLDGWAHSVEKPESFFTPWHLVLYSGFVAAVAYFGWRGLRGAEGGPGDRLMRAGLVLFIAGAVGDGAWHEIFGVEVDLEALLSPTHLALMTGGLLMLSGPVRSAIIRADREPTRASFFPTLVCLTLVVGLTSFFTMYLSAFEFGGLHSGGNEFSEVHGVAAVLVTNAILLGATFVAIRSWRTPFGTFTFMYGLVAFAMVAMSSFAFPLHVVAAAVGGLSADIAADRLRPGPGRVAQTRVFGVLVPLVLWCAWLVAVKLTGGITWAVELWTGTVVLAMVSGLGLSALVFERGAVTREMLPATPPETAVLAETPRATSSDAGSARPL